MLTKSPFFRSTAFRLEDLSPVPSGVFSLLILQAPGSRLQSPKSEFSSWVSPPKRFTLVWLGTSTVSGAPLTRVWEWSSRAAACGRHPLCQFLCLLFLELPIQPADGTHQLLCMMAQSTVRHALGSSTVTFPISYRLRVLLAQSRGGLTSNCGKISS